MSQTLTLVSLEDLRVLLSEKTIRNEIWGSQEAADYLGSSASTINKEAEAGVIPGVKVGKNWKFSSIALYEYVARKQVRKE
ncbi:excisionase family DNA-binding protein [Enterococcus sp. AD013-P3]|uniref:excisionase family DNA-binding protein n=1 Tax=Enterococcus sp. AD013-P3 TaxID=3411036 RepID=UPI003B95565D